MAIVTPSFWRDFELCRTLNRSVIEFLPSNVKHYIYVDARDLPLFAPLRSARTIIASKEEIMPKGIVQIAGFNRWRSTGSVLPISGWLVQQIAKIATAAVLSERVVVMVDSDAVFVRDVESQIFASGGKTRLYRSPGGISGEMTDHVKWYRNACRLLNVPEPPSLPYHDYIGQIISWDRRLVTAMCERIQSVTGRTWYDAIAQKRYVSEYLLYGAFVETLAPDDVWINEIPICNTRWELYPLQASGCAAFARSMDDHHVALMISSESNTKFEVRRAVIEAATNGRLR